jgi:hypothetical protein
MLSSLTVRRISTFWLSFAPLACCAQSYAGTADISQETGASGAYTSAAPLFAAASKFGLNSAENPARERLAAEGTGAATPPPSDSTYKRQPSPPGAKVYFVYPKNGATVPQKVRVKFGLDGMGIAPAGFEKANTGHHHLLIDSPLPPFDEPIPSDFNHLHFGEGQTEEEVTLPLGKHTLQLLLGDANHVPHDPPVFSQPIQVLVTETGKKPKSHRHYR